MSPLVTTPSQGRQDSFVCLLGKNQRNPLQLGQLLGCQWRVVQQQQADGLLRVHREPAVPPTGYVLSDYVVDQKTVYLETACHACLLLLVL
jgi:hypothetical protein